jgi:hypothetical protein
MAESGWTWSRKTSDADATPSYATAVAITAIPSSAQDNVPLESYEESLVHEMGLRVVTDTMDTAPAIDDRVTDPDGTNWRVTAVIQGKRMSGTTYYQIRDESTIALGNPRGRR